MLCRAACHSRTVNMVAFLAQTGTCPQPLARLALQLFPQQAQERNNGMLPLHLWAKSHSYNTRMDGLLQPLLQAYPQAATTTCNANRQGYYYPLQLALASGKSWTQVQPLVKAAPHVLEYKEPLPLIVLACLAPKRCPLTRARQACAGEKGLVTLWNLVRAKQELIEKANEQLECEQLTTLYHILQAYPQALPKNV